MELHFMGCGSGFNPMMKNTNAFFKVEGNLYIIDCGESSFEQLYRSGELKNSGVITVIVTHLHSDHCGSLAMLVSYCRYELNKLVNVIHPSGNINKLLHLMGIEAEEYAYHETIPNFLSSQVEIEAVEVQHAANMKCYGYIITQGNDCIFYSGDAAAIPQNVLDMFISGSIKRMYVDTSSKEDTPPSHGYFEYHKKVIPRDLRHRVFCMHLDCDFCDKLTSEGFQVVQPEEYPKRIQRLCTKTKRCDDR